jgi:hypothetical protein
LHIEGTHDSIVLLWHFAEDDDCSCFENSSSFEVVRVQSRASYYENLIELADLLPDDRLPSTLLLILLQILIRKDDDWPSLSFKELRP